MSDIILQHSCRSINMHTNKETGNTEYDDSENLYIIIKSEFLYNISYYTIGIYFYQKIPGPLTCTGCGWYGGGMKSPTKRVIEYIHVPCISNFIIGFIEKIELSKKDTIDNGTLVVAKIKKQIEDKLDEDPILRQSRKFNIIDEIQQLKKSILPSKEITELQTTTSTLKSDTSQLTKLLQSSNELSKQADLKISQLTKLVEDSKYCSVQSSLKISHLVEENEKRDSEMLTMKSSITQLQNSTMPSCKEITELQQTTSSLQSNSSHLTKLLHKSVLKISHLVEEKEKHDSELSTMKSSISQLQEDMKMLFRKTSELHYENTLLKKMLEEKIKIESSGLSFTQANTIGQALMQHDVFNCM